MSKPVHPDCRPLSRSIGRLAATSGLIGAVLAACPIGWARESLTYDMTSGYRPGQLYRIDAHLKVGGHLKISSEGKVERVPMSVVAEIGYREKLLRVPSGEGDQPIRSVRHYTRAEAVIKIDRGGVKPSLKDERTWIAAESEDGQSSLFGLDAPLERDELDLIDIPGNSLLFPALLPARPVAVGDTWRQSAEVLSALLGLDAVSNCDVESRLEKVERAVATISLAGSLHGAVDGVATDIDLKGRYRVDLATRTIGRFELAIKEARSIGHVGPGLDVTARLTLQSTRVARSSDRRLVRLTDEDIPGRRDEQAKLVYDDPSGTYRLRYDRNWFVVTEEPKLTVLRQVDRGELVAQCNISTLPRKAPERATQLKQLQRDIRFSLGKRFGRFLKSTEWGDSSGHRIYRVVVGGRVDQLPIQWRYYLLVNRDGRRLAVSFTVEESLVDRLGDADQQLVAGIAWAPATRPDTRRTADRKARSSH